MIPLTDDGHRSRGLGSDKGVDGRVLKFPSTSPNELRVTLYDPSRGVPVVELEVIKQQLLDFPWKQGDTQGKVP